MPYGSPLSPARPILHAHAALLLLARHHDVPSWLSQQHLWSIVVVVVVVVVVAGPGAISTVPAAEWECGAFGGLA